MDRRWLIVGVVGVAVVVLGLLGANFLLSFGDCGLGTGGVYPVDERDGAVRTPEEARYVAVQAFERGDESSRPVRITRFVPNRTVFNERYVYRAEMDREFREAVDQRQSFLEDGEDVYYFSRSGTAISTRPVVGVSETGDVFVVEAGAC